MISGGCNRYPKVVETTIDALPGVRKSAQTCKGLYATA